MYQIVCEEDYGDGIERATYDVDLPHAATGNSVNCDLCGRNADHIIHRPMTQQASHNDLLVTERGS